MNVLLVNAAYSPFVGGAEAYLRAMAERLASDGHYIQVVTTDAGEVEAFWDPRKRRITVEHATVSGVSVLRLPLAYLPLSPQSFYVLRRLMTVVGRFRVSKVLLRGLAPFIPQVPRLPRVLRDLPYHFDLVHGVNIALEWPLIAAWHHARAVQAAFIATPFVHVGEPGNTIVSRNYCMPHQMEPLIAANAVIVQTTLERDFLVQRGVKAPRVHVHGMGVDLAEVQGGDPNAFRQAYSIDGPIVLFLGVITKDKGSVHLIEAMRRLWEAGVDAKLVMAGRPVSEFEQYWATLPPQVARRVIRTGMVQGQNKRNLLAAATVLVMPSRIDSFGAVYLEAWANGIPVIGARAGGVPAVIAEGRDGLLVDYGDVSDLAAAIQRLLADDNLRRELAASGYKKVADRYTWDRIYAQLISLYGHVKETFGRERSRV